MLEDAFNMEADTLKVAYMLLYLDLADVVKLTTYLHTLFHVHYASPLFDDASTRGM